MQRMWLLDLRVIGYEKINVGVLKILAAHLLLRLTQGNHSLFLSIYNLPPSLPPAQFSSKYLPIAGPRVSGFSFIINVAVSLVSNHAHPYQSTN